MDNFNKDVPQEPTPQQQIINQTPPVSSNNNLWSIILLTFLFLTIIVVVIGKYYLEAKNQSNIKTQEQFSITISPSPILQSKTLSRPLMTPKPSLTPTPSPSKFQSAIDTNLIRLKQYIATGGRDDIKTWANPLSISTINAAVDGLSQNEKDKLANLILNISGDSTTQQKEDARLILLTAIKLILGKRNLGFYAEILSYTNVNITGNGLFGNCNNVYLTPGTVNQSLDIQTARDILMHETFHSFNCVNNGPSDALNEGSAVWIFKVGFPENRIANELKAGWAETTYGTVNYYRDIGIGGNRNISLLTSSNSSQKLIDVYNWLSANDSSKLPWNSQNKLQSCYDKYYKDLDRNVDFNLWLGKAAERSQTMSLDESCHPN